MATNHAPTLVWFRNDLRLADNPALASVVVRHGPVIPVFVWDPAAEGNWKPGAASQWWLHQSLASLDFHLRRLDSRLVIRCGETRDVLFGLVNETKADAIFWNRRYEPAVIARDRILKNELRTQGIQAESFNAALLFEPWEVRTSTGKPFQVFTPFWKTWMVLTRWPRTQRLESLRLESTIDWAVDIRAAWLPGEEGAKRQLEQLLNNALAVYPQERDRPDHSGTSRLSPHLHFGEIGPRQIWREMRRGVSCLGKAAEETTAAYLRQLGWREFAYHLLFHLPQTTGSCCEQNLTPFPGEKIRTPFEHGVGDVRGILWLMLVCVNCGRPVGCITEPGW